jgi:hypothetical protein
MPDGKRFEMQCNGLGSYANRLSAHLSLPTNGFVCVAHLRLYAYPKKLASPKIQSGIQCDSFQRMTIEK